MVDLKIESILNYPGDTITLVNLVIILAFKAEEEGRKIIQSEPTLMEGEHEPENIGSLDAWLSDGCLLPVSSRGLFSLPICIHVPSPL